MLSEKSINEFKELYVRRYGVELTDQEAREQASNLLRLYKVVYAYEDESSRNQKNGA